MKTIYMKIVLGHPSLNMPKICIVGLSKDHTAKSIQDGVAITTYVEPVKQKACEKLGLNADETIILDWIYLGEEVHFIM